MIGHFDAVTALDNDDEVPFCGLELSCIVFWGLVSGSFSGGLCPDRSQSGKKRVDLQALPEE